MATDNSPPKIRIILTVAFSSVVILVALNYVFRSYFLMMTEEVEHEHLRAPEELLKLHAGEERNLTSSPVPIARAMQTVARGREGVAEIAPQPSNDMGPMVGWIRNPNQAVIDKLNAEANADAGTAAAESAAADAAAATNGPSDAGAPTLGTKLPDGGASPTQMTGGEPTPNHPGSSATSDAGTKH